MIELLVVIGIILILIGLFFAGAKLVTEQARERDTKSMLETCKTMFENYRQATKLARYPAGISFGPPGTITWYTAQETAIGAASPEALGLLPAPQQLSSTPVILLDSAYVFYAMESLPENQTIIADLPASKRINVYLPGSTTQVSLPLDGWGNVILFVPGGGLTGVFVDPADNGGSTQIITSEGVQPSTWSPSATVNPCKPFFVSAGPDGDVSNAHGYTWSTATSAQQSSMTDDNIYSFQN
jgi:type II secretory pathway pseudopilin PulG